jgi:hypothetical protein
VASHKILHPTRRENKHYRRQAGGHSGFLVELKIELKIGFRILGPKKLRGIASVFILLSACFRLARPGGRLFFQGPNGRELPHGIRFVRSRADAGTSFPERFAGSDVLIVQDGKIVAECDDMAKRMELASLSRSLSRNRTTISA